MPLHKYRERLRIIDHHIQTKAPGNIEIVSRKLSLSVAGAYKFLEEMKDEGFPIAYSKKENRYYYTKNGQMIGYVFVEDTGDGAEKNSRGGGKNFLKYFQTIIIVEIGKVTLYNKYFSNLWLKVIIPTWYMLLLPIFSV